VKAVYESFHRKSLTNILDLSESNILNVKHLCIL